MIGAARADSVAEQAFADAAHYTVRISVSTDYSFIESEKGGWTGAGFLVDRARRWVLTNAHVAGYTNAKILVAFKGGPRVAAKAKFVDNFVDVAVLELPESSIPAEAREARLACEGTPAVGSDLGAIRDAIEERNAVIVAGFGRFGQIVARVLSGLGVGVTIVDHDPNQIETVRRFGWKAYYEIGRAHV